MSVRNCTDDVVIDRFREVYCAVRSVVARILFWRGHNQQTSEHCTKFGHECYGFPEIMASIIQGSSIGPASYVVTASDQCALTQGNSMAKFADDTYLIVPASNLTSCASDITNIEQWANNNNLSLNRGTSAEIAFLAPRSRRYHHQSPALSGSTLSKHLTSHSRGNSPSPRTPMKF